MPTNLPIRGKKQKPPAQPQARVAEPWEVPEHLVGKAYRDFTPAEHWEAKKFRRSRNHCHACGNYQCRFGKIKNHGFTGCPLRRKVNQFREQHNLCLECGKADHNEEACPILERLERECAPFGERWSVPKEYVGWSIAVVPKDKLEAHRLKSGLCRECGARGHKHYTCEIRLNRVQKRYENKLADIASGKKVLNLALDGPLGRLPEELRMEILIMAMKNDGDTEVEPGYLHPIRSMVRVGVHLDEAISAFVQGNVFKFSGSTYGFGNRHQDRSARFEQFLKKYDASRHLRAVHLHDREVDLPPLLGHCHGLKKIKLPVRIWCVSEWQEAMYNGGHITMPENKVPGLVEGLDLQAM